MKTRIEIEFENRGAWTTVFGDELPDGIKVPKDGFVTTSVRPLANGGLILILDPKENTPPLSP